MSRSIFCGNLDYDARHSELERLFSRYGKVDRVDMKSGNLLYYCGFAFIYMDDERDAEDAIRGVDRLEFGRHGRRLRAVLLSSTLDFLYFLINWTTSKLMDRVISVEYAVRDDDERRNGCSPDRRGRERSRSRDRGRSLSPYGRRVERASPDYGRGPSPYTKADERVSPKYERARSPAHDRDYR
ncbi:hypothetical protein B296_00007178 [Ensete ventricosum]|uniref:RRM domain-containing protein n=1 Tax=Ensete ventricosum TaxID=4639 RepID=A0A427B6V9_ENSVE|nr:hypothetical protein B296_00007178 [Ensete ventricosum]